MSPIDILGGILARRTGGSSGGGLGGSILESVLRGGRPGAVQRESGEAGIPARPPGSPRIIEPADGGQEFDSLEDLLRSAHQRNSSRGVPAAKRQPVPTSESESQISRRQTDFDNRYQSNPAQIDQQAEVLIRAMVNAAKSDGQIDSAEQEAITQQIGELSSQDLQFLRSEFAKPLDVREFVWSVPVGMEKQVYALSLMTIRLDSNAEASYLKELAHGFRMTLADCNRIHQEYGVPQLR